MVLAPSDWNSPAAESARYDYTLGGRRTVCRTDGGSFSGTLSDELKARLRAFPAGRPPRDWDGVVVTEGDLPEPDPATNTTPWTRGTLRALYAVLSADGAGAAASSARSDAANGYVSALTLRGAIWETIAPVVREGGVIVSSVDPATGARRRMPGWSVDIIRLPAETVPPWFDVAPPLSPAGSSGAVCGEPSPDRDLDTVPTPASWIANPLFILGVAAAGLFLASAISQRGEKVSDWDRSRRRKF